MHQGGKIYQLSQRHDTWVLTGRWQVGGEPAQVRCTIEFGDEGDSRTCRWESSREGDGWEVFWDLKAIRA